MCPFVVSDHRPQHKRPRNRYSTRQRMPGGGSPRTCPAIQIGGDAKNDKTREATIEKHYVARCKRGVADDRLMPGRVLLSEEAGADEYGKDVDKNQRYCDAKPAQFFTGLKTIKILGPGEPYVTPQSRREQRLEGKDRVEHLHPVSLEFR